MMKKSLTLFAAFVIFSSAFSQPPEKMSYQAVIRNSSDALVVNTQVGMQISILQYSATGSVVFSETQTPTTNANGLVSIEIGSGEGFDTIDWAAGPYFLKTETDPDGGTNYTITGASQLLNVPYAFYAKTAENGFSGNYSDLIDKPENLDEDKTDDVTLTGNQTISGNKIFTGTTAVITPVNEQDAANKAYVDALKETLYNELLLAGLYGVVFDLDGNAYKTKRIGSQVWMAENLKTTKYNNNTSIPLVTDESTWANLNTAAYCWYGNDSGNYKATYGALYNWYAVSVTTNGSKNVCPTGWHIPTDAEWTTLTDYCGGESVAGGKLKETGTTHWASSGTGDTNESGFTALPGGFRYFQNGSFMSIGFYGYWWTSTEAFTSPAPFPDAYIRSMAHFESYASRFSDFEKNGFSVRCLKD